MSRSFFTWRRTLAMVAVLLTVNSVLPRRWSVKAGYPLRGLVTLAAAPLAGPLASFAASVRGGSRQPATTDSKAQLERRLERARVLNGQLHDKLKAADRQLKLLTKSSRITLAGIKMTPARVTGYSDSRTNPTLTLNQGRNQGITAHAAVVSGVSLVGRVDMAYPRTADVKLILAAQTRLQVRIVPPKLSAGPREAQEMLEISDDGEAFHVRVSRDAPIRVGDLAQLSDDRWPMEAHGFVVGKVTRIKPSTGNKFLFKQVIVRPTAPLRSLSRATVLTPVE